MLKGTFKKNKKLTKNIKNHIYSWLILVILFIVIVLISIFLLLECQKSSVFDITNVQELWLIYDINIEKIGTNLTEISMPTNDIVCNVLKGTNVDDKYYQDALNDLLCSIQLYYYDLIEYNENYSNYLLDYRSVTKINKKDFNILIDKLKQQQTIYDRLKRLSNLKISESTEKRELLLSKINDFLKFNEKFYNKENLTYQEVFIHKVVELEYVVNLSEWLRNEYYYIIN